MEDEQLSARDFGAAFKGFLEQVSTGVPGEEPIFARRCASTSAPTRPRSRS